MISLSPSKLNLLNECPRCFYDQNNKIVYRPKGIVATITRGIDRVVKEHCDNFRGSLPPELQGQVPGVLIYDMQMIKKWRQWQTGPKYVDEKLDVTLIGALDDCLVDNDIYIPFDVKSKGSEPKDAGERYYQLQLDCYCLMLEANGYKTDDRAFLAYYYPQKIEPREGEEFTMEKSAFLNFGVKVYELKCDKQRAKDTIKRAVELLKGERPKVNYACEYCRFVEHNIQRLPKAKI